ncbi:HTTM domain-containing protein [Natrinema altunense]|uniref:HTTM domain protein n=1 Tax=Natrinema altunense (strain JCM 12890 / CGMCC 1.3731 / AJ2) TaxID=1227494 RepID=M0A1G2_NATA2|nr:HTTM domain-containing protein [Natrinema altunense]ELY91203.1 HTTM domain protein [Natrinema altunense JCM 12890]
MTRALLTNGRNRLLTALDTASESFVRRFEIDLRALAAFRIALGTLVIVDLLLRSRHLTAFYTDDGVLPLEALFSDYSSVYSLHAISGEAWVQAVLFVVAGCFAFAMVVGYRTRLATLVSWLLLLSLHTRNPMVLNGGDALFRMLLFWAIFLPLGERWAIDARRTNRDRTTVASVGTMAVLLQPLLMYASNAIHKYRGDSWMAGDAIAKTFRADQFTILLGNVIADQILLLRVFTYLWVGLILLSPLLVILMGRRRAMFASLFVGMHLGMLVTIRVGIFPLVAVTALLPFYPPVFWNWLDALATRAGIASQLRGGVTRLQRDIPTLPVPQSPSIRPALSRLTAVTNSGRVLFSTILPGLFLFLVVLSSAGSVGYDDMPDRGEEVLETVQAEQSWKMFAPDPIWRAKWLVVPGKLEDGTKTDVYRDTDVHWKRPPSVDQTYESARWRKYIKNMRFADNENHRSYFANYLCGRWNATHETGVERLTIYGQTDTAAPYEESDITTYELHEYDCSGEFIQRE